jgi:hypothetical protein
MSVAVALQFPGVRSTGPRIEADFLLTVTGSYVNGTGDGVDFRGLGIPGNSVPDVQISSQAGYIYKYKRGTNLGDGKLLVFIPTTPSSNAPFAEHSSTTYNAGVTGDTIRARVSVVPFKA